MSGTSDLSPALAARVLAAVPLQHRQRLQGSFAIGWLPFEVHMAVLQALRSTLGARAYQKLCATQIAASLDNPVLFAKPVRAALKLYGATPFAIFRAIPLSLRYIFRDAGQFRVSMSADGQAFEAFYEDFPPRFSEGDTWSLIWMATLEAIAAYVLDGTAIEAHIALVRHEPERGYFEWHGRSSPRPNAGH